jgi:uncharacterized membrane protein
MIDFTYLHPMIVHFPIALLVIGFLSEVAGAVLKKQFFSTAALYLIILGTLGVVAAYLSGGFAGEGIAESGPMKQALETHESSAVLTLWLVVVAALVRVALAAFKKFHGSFQWFAIALFLVAVLSMARTGHYGGQLVFKHAAGVRLELELND